MPSQSLNYNVLLVICQLVYCIKKDLNLSESDLENYFQIIKTVVLNSTDVNDIEDNLRQCLNASNCSINKNAVIEYDSVRLDVLREKIAIEQFGTNPINNTSDSLRSPTVE